MKKIDAGIQWLRQTISRVWEMMPSKPMAPSQVPIDIVIPIIGKDLDILPLCLQGIRKNVSHPVKDIYIVAPNDPAIKAFCEKEHLVFVEESTIFNFSPRELNLIITSPNGHTVNRSGWLFQQFVKLSGKVGTCDYFLCIDADHILIRPHVFLDKDEIPVFYMSDECHTAYYKNIRRLTGEPYFSLLSFVDHKMLFSKKELAALRQKIEQANDGCEWKEAIVASYDRTETSGFSEFELYGHFVSRKHKQPWRQVKLAYKDMADFETLTKRYAAKYHCITFPCYLK
jgi:hypothetical protein